MREDTEQSGQLLSNLDYSLELQVLLSLFFEMLISWLSLFVFHLLCMFKPPETFSEWNSNAPENYYTL